MRKFLNVLYIVDLLVDVIRVTLGRSGDRTGETQRESDSADNREEITQKRKTRRFP